MILSIVLAVLLFGALLAWPYRRSWGSYPNGGLGLVLVVLIVLLLAVRLRIRRPSIFDLDFGSAAAHFDGWPQVW
jgi:Protein of unknown function (DUF3309)